MSLSWVTPGTDVFYNRASMGDRVLAIVLGSSPQPGDFLRIQYEVGGKVVVHEAAALHRIEFQIRSPSPSPSLSPHNPMRTIQVDLLLKMGEVLQLQLIHWWTPNPTKTPPPPGVGVDIINTVTNQDLPSHARGGRLLGPGTRLPPPPPPGPPGPLSYQGSMATSHT